MCIVDAHGTDLNHKFRRDFTEYYDIVNENKEELSQVQLFKGNGMINLLQFLLRIVYVRQLFENLLRKRITRLLH